MFPATKARHAVVKDLITTSEVILHVLDIRVDNATGFGIGHTGVASSGFYEGFHGHGLSPSERRRHTPSV